MHTFKGHTEAVMSVAISSDQTIIFSGSSDNSIKVWDIHTGQCITTLQGHHNTVSSIAMPPPAKVEKKISHIQQNGKQNAQAAERISAIENNINRLDIETKLNAFDEKIKSLQEQHIKEKVNADNTISDLQKKLEIALDEGQNMKKKQEKNEHEIDRANARILLLEAILDKLLQETTKKI